MTTRILALFSLLLSAAVFVPSSATAQRPSTIAVSDTTWQVQLTDGSTIFGRVAEVDGTRITFRGDGGTQTTVDRSRIRSMSPLRGEIRDGEVWPTDPNATRLYFGPTGRMMEAGQGYIAAYELFLPFVSYSLTDRFAIAGGTPILPGVIGEILYLAPKVGLYQTQSAAVAAGILAFFSTDTDFDSAGILYGVGTLGEPDASGTLGVGWPFASGDLASRPVAMLGGEARISPRLKALTENYFVVVENEGNTVNSNEFFSVLSGGVRFIGDRLSADLGIGVGVGDGGAECCIPLVNFVYQFGQ